jgi:regulator of PEP synthase PpsR (kinase-PPPase family)
MTFEEEQDKLRVIQKQLYQEKKDYLVQLTIIEDRLMNIEQELTQHCIQFFEKHDYIMEQESGMYGETFYICSRCNTIR